jgi:hypothetical protein
MRLLVSKSEKLDFEAYVFQSVEANGGEGAI